MSEELKIGVELLISGLVAVFAILFIFKIIMDMMSVTVARIQRKKRPPILSELELAAVLAVIKHKRPCLHGAEIELTFIEEKTARRSGYEQVQGINKW